MLRRSIFIPAMLPVVLLTFMVILPRRHMPRADFRFPLGDSPKTLDPAQMVYNEEHLIAGGLWEGLTTYDPKTTEPISGVATLPCQISPDGCSYTFQLRPEARWSNGDPVTADDFVYAWRRAIEPGTAGDYAFLLTDNIVGAKMYYNWRNQAVKILSLLRQLQTDHSISPEDRQWLGEQLPQSLLPDPDWTEIARQFRKHHLAQTDEQFKLVQIQAVSDHQLRVALNRPTPYFLDLTGFATFLPVHRKSLETLRIIDDPAVTDLTLWAYDPQWVKPDPQPNGYPGLITNGPFLLKEWQFKRFILLEKNPCYWDRQNVRSNRVLARIMTEPGATFLVYEKNDLDWYRNLDRLDFTPALIEQMKNKKRNDIHCDLAFANYYYMFNCKPKLHDGRTNPFHDPKVRMAFNLAVDKKAITDNIRKTGNPPARNFIPPGSIVGYQCPDGPDFNPEQARSLLAEAGFPNGHHLPNIEILYNTGYSHGPVAEALAEMWSKELNAKVTLIGKEVKSYEEDRSNQRFMICRSGWFGDYLDPTTFLDMMTTENGNNKAAFSNPQYDLLIQKAAQTVDFKERLAILSQAEQILIFKQMPFLPIYYYVNLHAWRPCVKGLYPNPRDQHPLKTIYTE